MRPYAAKFFGNQHLPKQASILVHCVRVAFCDALLRPKSRSERVHVVDTNAYHNYTWDMRDAAVFDAVSSIWLLSLRGLQRDQERDRKNHL